MILNRIAIAYECLRNDCSLGREAKNYFFGYFLLLDVLCTWSWKYCSSHTLPSWSVLNLDLFRNCPLSKAIMFPHWLFLFCSGQKSHAKSNLMITTGNMTEGKQRKSKAWEGQIIGRQTRETFIRNISVIVLDENLISKKDTDIALVVELNDTDDYKRPDCDFTSFFFPWSVTLYQNELKCTFDLMWTNVWLFLALLIILTAHCFYFASKELKGKAFSQLSNRFSPFYFRFVQEL